MRRNTRPKWAKNLTAAQWKHLQACQCTARPSLRQLRWDVEHQHVIDVTCWDCKQALARTQEPAA